MTDWLLTLPERYQSLFAYLVDWCDVPPAEAKQAVEDAIRDDSEFEKRLAA